MTTTYKPLSPGINMQAILTWQQHASHCHHTSPGSIKMTIFPNPCEHNYMANINHQSGTLKLLGFPKIFKNQRILSTNSWIVTVHTKLLLSDYICEILSLSL